MALSNNLLKTALISVSDKRGLVELGRALSDLSIQIISTGGSARELQHAGIAVTAVADITGMPEILNGRVKTLHPNIYGGILSRGERDARVLAQHQISPIDLVIVNLYPFTKTIAQAHCTRSDAIAQIDIGGPCMIRAAAKNYEHVTVCVDPDDYAGLIQAIQSGELDEDRRFNYAKKSFQHTAFYDAKISNYFSRESASVLPETLTLASSQYNALRYGENPHQQAGLYTEEEAYQQQQGKPLSYNNIADAHAAFEAVAQFQSGHACVIVKHANPCGVSVSESSLSAYENAYKTDPKSSFGGIIAFNSELCAECAKKILANQFVEVIIAPEISPAALQVLSAKPLVRVLTAPLNVSPALQIKTTRFGHLVQTPDTAIISANDCKLVTKTPISDASLADCLFANKVVKATASNAIIIAKNQSSVGIGAGQMSRVDSVMLAAHKAQEAGLDTNNAVLASDAFFPFEDSIEHAARLGIKAIIQPGGSKRDQAIIDAADKANIAMIMTGTRHFKHG